MNKPTRDTLEITAHQLIWHAEVLERMAERMRRQANELRAEIDATNANPTKRRRSTRKR